ncbi:IS3 family transposase [Mumia flava]|uniref:IS3 family transposase n=1 Tax=Mumia flava TaxID=1348852 RepID=UPI0014771001|nr:IS3 family transposase [Mumia flava]
MIATIHAESNGTYGIARIHAELTLGRGVKVGHNQVHLLMRRAGLQGVTGRRKWKRIKPDNIACDLVERDFARQRSRRFSSTTSLGVPGTLPWSTSTRRAHVRKVSGLIPNSSETCRAAADLLWCSGSASANILSTRSRISGSNFFGIVVPSWIRRRN